MNPSTCQLILILLCSVLFFKLKAQEIVSEFETIPNLQEEGFLPKRMLDAEQAFECNKARCAFKIQAEVRNTFIINAKSSIKAQVLIDNETDDLTVFYGSSILSGSLRNGLYVQYEGERPIVFGTPDTAAWKFVVPKTIFRASNFKSLYFTLANDLDFPVAVMVTMSFNQAYSSDLSPIKFLLPLVSVLLTAILIAIAIRVRRARLRRSQQNMPKDEQSDKTEGDEVLTPENLNGRFPQTQFSEVQSTFPQTTCSICIEEFNKETPCRQLYCEHIFHSECIELWLNNELKKGYASCPNCKKDMMKKKIQPEAEAEAEQKQA